MSLQPEKPWSYIHVNNQCCAIFNWLIQVCNQIFWNIQDKIPDIQLPLLQILIIYSNSFPGV